jgi:putative chitinase
LRNARRQRQPRCSRSERHLVQDSGRCRHLAECSGGRGALATISIESAKLSKTVEGLYYKDPIRLASIFPRTFKNAAEAVPYTRNPEALGKLLYEGDYWGRGLIQLSWLKNYKAAGDALGFDYATNPELVAEPKHAALTAGWYWDHANCNASADIADMRGVTQRVNGPALMHLAERMTQYVKNVAVLT